METEADKKIRAHCNVMEKVASEFTKGSIEQETLKVAAFAYSFAVLRHEQEFADYLLSVRKPLTEQEQDYLRKLGS